MKARHRLLGYEEHREPVEIAFLVYMLAVTLLLAASFAAMFPSAIDFGAWLADIENFLRDLASTIGLG